MLHTLSCSPWRCDIIYILNVLDPEDDLLLFQDGVFAAINNSYFARMLVSATVNVFALKEDIEARGLIDQISTGINIVDYSGFVDLTVKQSNHINWK